MKLAQIMNNRVYFDLALRKYVKKWPNCSQGEDSLKIAMLMPKTILIHF